MIFSYGSVFVFIYMVCVCLHYVTRRGYGIMKMAFSYSHFIKNLTLNLFRFDGIAYKSASQNNKNKSTETH